MERFGLGNAGTEPGSGGSGTGGLGQTGKKKPKKQPFSRTYRFDLSLNVTEDDGDKSQLYPDFNWLDLVAQEEEKKLEDKKKQVLDPFGSDDDDVRAMAKKFEEKYGGVSEKIKKKKKIRKIDDYADLGYGYDSDDPFIDNSDVHDEIVPDNLTTAHGGFMSTVAHLNSRLVNQQMKTRTLKQFELKVKRPLKSVNTKINSQIRNLSRKNLKMLQP